MNCHRIDGYATDVSYRLYDNHPNGNEAMLIETMELLKWTGVPWELVFAPAVSPASFVYNISINGCVPWYVKHFPTGPGDVFS